MSEKRTDELSVLRRMTADLDALDPESRARVLFFVTMKYRVNAEYRENGCRHPGFTAARPTVPFRAREGQDPQMGTSEEVGGA